MYVHTSYPMFISNLGKDLVMSPSEMAPGIYIENDLDSEDLAR